MCRVGSLSLWLSWRVLSAVAVHGWRELNAHDATRRRRVQALRALRIGTAVLAWFVVAQPVWVGERMRQTRGRLAVLLDASRSVAVGPADGTTREEEVRDLLRAWEEDEHSGDTAWYRFGEALEAETLGGISDRYRAREDASRLVASIRSLVEADIRGELGAIAVVSDGADPELAGALERGGIAGVKVHTIRLGDADVLRDESIVDVRADPVAFLRQAARVHVEVAAFGTSDDAIPVQLRRGDQVIRERVAELDENGRGQVDLEFTPDRLGRSVYRVTIPVSPSDAVPQNNSRAFLVRVTREKLRVLLVAGRPSWDQRFLRAFLKRDPAIDLISFFILRTANDLTMANPDELALIPFPTDELFSEHLGSFDLVIFQNFEFGPYQMARYLPGIRDFVERGGAFAMIGGNLSFASGGYSDTAIAELLPVALESQGPAPIATGPFRPQLVAALARHPLLELLPHGGRNLAAWSALAPLHGTNRVGGVRGGAQALLTHPSEKVDGAAMPVLAVGTYGRGRTLAFTTDTSYRWGIATAGQTGDVSAYERFWDRALRWLTQDPALEAARITTNRERYGAGGRVVVRGVLRDERYQPLGQVDVRVGVFDTAGEELHGANAVADVRGRFSVAFDAPMSPGGYRVAVRRTNGQKLAEEGFVVESGGDELADPRAHGDWLERLAETTGAVSVPAGRAPDLGTFDTTRTRSLGFERIAPFGSVVFVFVVAAFLGTEWVLRRRWGYR